MEEHDLIDEKVKKMITNIFELDDDGRRRDDPPHRDRKRGGKHARRRRGTPF
ncbi:MAG: hypothetical protein ACLR7U_05785 [Ruthenibacterium lactatiformans]